MAGATLPAPLSCEEPTNPWMGSGDDATTFLDIRPCRGAGGVLVRIKRRGQLDEIDVPRCREPDVRACADHGGSDESPHAGQELRRRRGNQFL